MDQRGELADLHKPALFYWEPAGGRGDWRGPGADTGGNPDPGPDGLLDLVFKDDVTFYSGNPHLGFTGELPPTVATLSAPDAVPPCGEFYFPWHSHALQTVQNFDEGFGGMHTLVRVDPPGGCPTQ